LVVGSLPGPAPECVLDVVELDVVELGPFDGLPPHAASVTAAASAASIVNARRRLLTGRPPGAP